MNRYQALVSVIVRFGIFTRNLSPQVYNIPGCCIEWMSLFSEMQNSSKTTFVDEVYCLFRPNFCSFSSCWKGFSKFCVRPCNCAVCSLRAVQNNPSIMPIHEFQCSHTDLSPVSLNNVRLESYVYQQITKETIQDSIEFNDSYQCT